jgi:asparagine synthase (glutamine-hydrolysing)
MCGIFLYFSPENPKLTELMPAFMHTTHRGPDSSTLRKIAPGLFMGFHRLAIHNLTRSGDQPFEDDGVFSVCNGEIYNHVELRAQLDSCKDNSCDCAVLLPLYAQEQGVLHNMVRRLDGDFAIIIADTKAQKIHLGRDPAGVKPLFYVLTTFGELIVASEMKSILPLLLPFGGQQVSMLPAGTTLTFDMDMISKKKYDEAPPPPQMYWDANTFFFPPSPADDDDDDVILIKRAVRDQLVQAVAKRLSSDRPVGLFISGGLDSSLIAGIATRLTGGTSLPSFAIGMPGSPDVRNAQIVADYLGTQHHTVSFDVAKGLAAVSKVIQHLETYDITTIRASVPQYLLAQYVACHTDVKVVLSGEGSDELFGGYLYSHLAPSNDALQADSARLVRELQHFDVLRTDRTTAAHGLEVRVPFLDRDFIQLVAGLPARHKNPNASSGQPARIEKALLREAFAHEAMIPDEILQRTKDAFSDACGYNWIPMLQAHCETLVSDEDFSQRALRFPHLPPPTKEAYYYRQTFEQFFPDQQTLVPHYWLPQWVPNNTRGEPSAKILQLV